MKKLLNTVSEESIYNSLAEIVGINKEYIQYYIMKYGIEIIKEITVDSIDLSEFLHFLFRYNKDLEHTLEFDEITLSHLTTRTSIIHNQQLFNLFNALIQDTEIKEFLNNEGIVFELVGKKLKTIYNGKLVDWAIYFDGDWGSTARMVNNRLEGNSKGVTDKCVNGFLFNSDIHKHRNVSHIARLPEILENILRILGCASAITKWTISAKPYVITFKADVTNTIFDEDRKHTLNNRQKKNLLIKYCLYYLSIRRYSDWDEDDNPIIRLKDELSVPVSDILNIRLLDNQRRTVHHLT